MSLKKNYPWNVLIFPAATEIGLEIHRALSDTKEVILHGANLPGINIAAFHFQRLHELPSIHDPECLGKLRQLVAGEHIDAIFPAYDDVLVWLVEHSAGLTAEILTSPLQTCRICRSKHATYETFQDVVQVPRLIKSDESNIKFPVFVKPDRGQGSQRARRIDSQAELDNALNHERDLLIMEYLPGREYTIDCFSQRGRGVLFAQARTRMQPRNGIATITRAENMPIAKDWADKISASLEMCGPWFFQIKEAANGTFCLLEVAPRIAGSMALSRALGPNFPLLALYEAAGHKIDIDVFNADIVMGRSLDVRFIHNRLIDAVYIDLDDTLIVHNRVNIKLVALIFQCHNNHIPVHLITRHPGNVEDRLDRFCLSHLFGRIIQIQDPATLKSEFISEKNAILIDDSFHERHAVTKALRILCLDAASSVCLLDDRK